jgi:hypothetical protein
LLIIGYPAVSTKYSGLDQRSIAIGWHLGGGDLKGLGFSWLDRGREPNVGPSRPLCFVIAALPLLGLEMHRFELSRAKITKFFQMMSPWSIDQ